MILLALPVLGWFIGGWIGRARQRREWLRAYNAWLVEYETWRHSAGT